MDSITQLTYILFIYLLFAIIVERFLEILMAVYNYLELTLQWHSFWDREAESIRRKLEVLANLNNKDGIAMDSSGSIFWKVIESPITTTSSSGQPIVSTELVRRRSLQIYSRWIAFMIGTGLSFGFYKYSGYNMDLIVALSNLLSTETNSHLTKIPTAVRIILSGAAIASGVEPLHKLISTVEHYSKKNLVSIPTNEKGAQ